MSQLDLLLQGSSRLHSRCEAQLASVYFQVLMVFGSILVLKGCHIEHLNILLAFGWLLARLSFPTMALLQSPQGRENAQQDGIIRSDQVRSVAQSCLTLCNPMNCSTPGLPVHHQLLEFTETHVHRVSDAIQPSHPLSSPSPPAPNPSQHQSLFQ